MSTFNGEIVEIPDISVDYFVNANQQCYFLSHCHTDHTTGLASLQTEAPIYATSITALFVRRRYPHLEKNLKILEIGIPISVQVSSEANSFVVNAISAGHCAGSCMLLFQIEGFDILYTGDLRISLKNARNIKLLDEVRSNSNAILYIDSTFMKASFRQFPTQTESIKATLEIIEDFLKKSKNHKVTLRVPARYGYEYFLMELYSKLDEKVYIHESDVYHQYSSISLLASCVTMNDKAARIFLQPKFITSNLQHDKSDVMLNLHLSAMFWANWKGGSFVQKIDENSFRVCYATHNSLTEIQDFLMFLKPKKVYLNVVPSDAHNRNAMLKELDIIQQKYSGDVMNGKSEVEENKTSRKFTFKRL